MIRVLSSGNSATPSDDKINTMPFYLGYKTHMGVLVVSGITPRGLPRRTLSANFE